MAGKPARRAPRRDVDDSAERVAGEVLTPSEAVELRRTSLVRLDQGRRLVRVSEPLPASLAASAELLDDLAAAGRLADRSISASTAEVYDLNLTYWEGYCATNDVPAYPPVPGVVMAWIASMANRKEDAAGQRIIGTGLHHKTIVQRLAALSKLCSAQGWTKPTDHPDVAEVLAGCRRTLGVRARRQVAPMDIGVMRATLGALHAPTPTQLRDASVLVLAQHPDIRLGALVRLSWNDVTFDEGAVTLLQPPQARHGQSIPIRFEATGAESCPVAVLRRWHATAAPHSRWLVPKVTVAGVQDRPVAGRQVIHQILERLYQPVAAPRPLTPDALTAAFNAALQPSAAVMRDRSMLLTGFFTAARRSNVCRLTFGDVHHDPRKGVRVFFDRTKTDQEGAGSEKWLPFGKTPETCPVAAWLDWHSVVTDMLGFDPKHSDTPISLFPALTSAGEFVVDDGGVPQALSGEAFAEVVRRRVRAAGFDPTMFAGHSLRSGFITAAAEQGLRLDQIQQVSDHKNLDVLMSYIRSVDAWRDNPAAAIGL